VGVVSRLQPPTSNLQTSLFSSVTSSYRPQLLVLNVSSTGSFLYLSHVRLLIASDRISSHETLRRYRQYPGKCRLCSNGQRCPALRCTLYAHLPSSLWSLTVPKQPCVAKYTTGSTIAGCNGVDVACICSNKDFLSNIACCLVGVCDQADQEAATTYAHQICASNGVTNLPPAVSCASSVTSSSATSTGSNTASASTTPASATTPASSASVASTSSPSASPSKNAGPHNNVAGVGAGIIGGLAAVMGALV
jgi:hypothetical protein